MEIVAIHGNSMSAQTMKALSCITKNISLPGHDGKELNEEYNLINLSDYIVDEIAGEDVVLVGNSLGAILSHQVADRVKLKALISIGTPPLNYEILEGAVLENECTFLAYKADLSEDQMFRFSELISDDHNAQKVIYHAVKMAVPLVRSALMESISKGHLRDEREILRHLNIPMLFIACEDDKIVNNEKFKNLGFGTVKFVKGGHILAAEKPVELDKIIRNFLIENGIGLKADL